MQMLFILFFFFFSSRRRHTRWPRDWSSDVCSSDLKDMDHGRYAECDIRTRNGKGPAADQRTHNAGKGSECFARADLVTAMLGIANAREIGVIAGPVKRVANGSRRAESQQDDIDAVDIGHKQILHAAERGTE